MRTRVPYINRLSIILKIMQTMKKFIFSLAFIAAMLTSCVNNDIEGGYNSADAVDVVIGVNAPTLAATRAGETDMDSGLGAIDNFGDDEWAKYDIRYMLEVYDATEGFKNFDTPVCQRMVQTYDSYQETTFELRLVPDRTYKFVVWADFVLQGSVDDLNYNTADLKKITRVGSVKPMDESMDAYFIQQNILIKENGSYEPLTLTRPFGKLRVITTDLIYLNIGTSANRVNVKFFNHPIFMSLNAITGAAENQVTDEVEYSYAISKDAPYTAGYDYKPENLTIFADYIFVQPQEDGDQEVNFELEIRDDAQNRVIRSHKFDTQIPLGRNKLTTLIGNLLTTSAEFTILVDDDFDGEYGIGIDAEPLPQPVVTITLDVNNIKLKWKSIEGASHYTVQVDDDVEEVVNGTTFEFVGDYDVEYTFTIKAISSDTILYLNSDPVVVVVRTEPEPVATQEYEATLTFNSKDKRTTLSAQQQVWQENGIVLTNDKASSTNTVADYVSPARFYKGSKITLEAPGEIAEIIFDCSSSSYATSLNNSAAGTGTVSVSSDIVTVIPNDASSSYVIAQLTAQVRLDAVTVVYVQ